jgi:uncharacterized protein
MKTIRTLLAVFLLTPALLLATSIRDDAKLFSPEGVKKAEQKIDDLKKAYKTELFVETFAKAEKMDEAKNKQGKGDPKYFEKWAAARYKELKVDGVYVLICTDPNYLQVVSGKMMEKKGFDDKKRDELANLMKAQFKEKKFDAGLMAVVAEVSETLKEKTPAPKKTTTEKAVEKANSTAEGLPSWTTWLCVGLVALLGLWIVVGLIRAFMGVGQPQPQPYNPAMGGYQQPGMYQQPMQQQPAGGGGFFSSLLGGMVGAAAGMYVYNSFFGSSTPSVFGSTTPPADPNAGVDNSPQTSGGGGGWDQSTPADAGGGGGGDWGATQEDWGGGGGDGGDWGGGGDGGGDGGGGGDW